MLGVKRLGRIPHRGKQGVLRCSCSDESTEYVWHGRHGKGGKVVKYEGGGRQSSEELLFEGPVWTVISVIILFRRRCGMLWHDYAKLQPDGLLPLGCQEFRCRNF